MNEIIERALLKNQREQNFRIVYACESGSRAWGFPSEDSDYETLINRLVHDEALKKSINELLRFTRDGKELDRGPKIPELSDFIESEFSRLKTELPEQIGPKPNVQKLNELIRFSLAKAW